MDLSVAQTGQLSVAVERVLQHYLSAAGVRAAATRVRWIARINDELDSRRMDIATEDVTLEAVEAAQRILEEHLLHIGGADSVDQQQSIARAHLRLLSGKGTDAINRYFDQLDSVEDTTKMPVPASVRETEELRAVPEPAVLAMPVQAIELRSLNPFKLLARLLH